MSPRPSSTLKLTSTAFANNGLIPTIYTCEGENISPPLSISGVPPLSESLVIMMEDPDAPIGIWDHWLVYNIDPDTTLIPEGEAPPGVVGKGSAGNVGYIGPCPPEGMHRYVFTVYALDSMIPLQEGATKIDIANAINGHVLGEARLIGKYERVKAT